MSPGESPRPEPVVTVVIPTYGRARSVDAAVRSVVAQDLAPEAFELIVVDSSPDDAVAEVVRRAAAETTVSVRCVRKVPEGPGPSRNMGARLGRGRVIAFMDSDCQAAREWLRAGLAAFGPRTGIVQGAVAPDPTARRGAFTHYVAVERETFLYETANMFYDRRAFEGAGGFLHDLTPTADSPMGGEDTDLGWKVKRAGWESRFAADALVHHEVVAIPVWRWILIRRLFVFPLLLRRVPELRRFMCLRYFLDRAQATFALACIGAIGAIVVHPAALLACLPYAWLRGTEPTATLGGARRPLRVAAYLLRDAASLVVLGAGSIRYRRVLL